MIFMFVETSENNHKNGSTSDESFSLQELYDFICHILATTEETKKTLQAECDEARFALKPWPIETMVLKQLDKNTCTCEETLCPDEIAADIGRTLLRSAQLREKLADKLRRERQAARKPDLQQIYAPTAQSKPRLARKLLPNLNNDKNHSISNHEGRKNGLARSHSVSRQPAKFKTPRSSSLARPEKSAVENQQNHNNNHHPIPPHLRSSVPVPPSRAERKPATNFILANKLSVRSRSTSKNNVGEDDELANRRRLCKSTHDLDRLENADPSNNNKASLTSIRSDEVETLSELDRLIKKFSIESTANSSELRKNCPIHAENAATTIEEKIISSVDAIEGLDRFGVPPQMVKILKTYHNYIRAEVLQETQTSSRKNQEAAANFMNNFERINKKRTLLNDNKYQNLIDGYSSIFADCRKPNLKHQDIKALKLKFINLESRFNECNVKKTAGQITFVRSNPDESSGTFSVDMKNWISNGIWNYFCVSDLKGFFGSHCTRYSDRAQLVSFYDFVQKIQRNVYEIELINVLLRLVLPKLRELFDPCSQEFINLYKMIVTIAQIVNPKVPILPKAE
ncbi:hypothetical protein QAD02_023683 [Eretmocerus hayati]|uniref:Uncharacterized protein n=1 Tax=Eretmocerus hayati TaxID=131215 RepID=A0ACC2PXP0_9HYME|nr:hypothetical protein QAD02_023683 [Eretmocerus hayati]